MTYVTTVAELQRLEEATRRARADLTRAIAEEVRPILERHGPTRAAQLLGIQHGHAANLYPLVRANKASVSFLAELAPALDKEVAR